MHILKIGAGESLAKCISQFLGQCVQRLLTVVGPLRESLFIFADDSSDMSIGVEQLAVDLESHITTGGFQHRANLLNNRREVVGKFQILLIHNHLLPFLYYMRLWRESNERFGYGEKDTGRCDRSRPVSRTCVAGCWESCWYLLCGVIERQ